MADDIVISDAHLSAARSKNPLDGIDEVQTIFHLTFSVKNRSVTEHYTIVAAPRWLSYRVQSQTLTLGYTEIPESRTPTKLVVHFIEPHWIVLEPNKESTLRFDIPSVLRRMAATGLATGRLRTDDLTINSIAQIAIECAYNSQPFYRRPNQTSEDAMASVRAWGKIVKTVLVPSFEVQSRSRGE